MAGVTWTGELASLKKRLDAVERNIPKNVHAEVADRSETLIDLIDKNIKAKGLVSGSDDEKNQPQLLGSFDLSRPVIDTWTITSDAPHAAAIEEGSLGRNPEIKARNKETLKFLDQNGNPIYPKKIPTEPYEYYDELSGTYQTTSGSDGHPGNRAYNYISEVQPYWWQRTKPSIEREVKRTILEQRFTPISR